MKVVVTGANGYLGRHLVARLCALRNSDGPVVDEILAVDVRFDSAPNDQRVKRLTGNITDPVILDTIAATRANIVYHLAAISSGPAETNYALGRAVNLNASLALLDGIGNRTAPPIVVFSSTIAVFGRFLQAEVNDDTIPAPCLSYGAHKLAVETVLVDSTRRGDIRGRAIRLPGIVLRPKMPNGARSAFTGDLMRALSAREAYVCPVSPESTLWLMSLERCIDNLMHAGYANFDDAQRWVWTLPAIRASVGEIVDALAERFGQDVRQLLKYHPDPVIEGDFGRFPKLATPNALATGFKDDGSLMQLIERAFAASDS